ncbi:MAG TPA: hypothetical protein VH396_03260 [Chitinophagaceae bacterium]
MKKLRFVPTLLILGSIIGLGGCKKEIAQIDNEPNVAAISSVTSDLAEATGTEFGAGIQGGSANQKISVYNKFGVKYVRAMVQLKNFNNYGISTEKDLTQQGFKVVLNINWASPGGRGGKRNPVPFPTDMDQYKQQLIKLFNTYKPEIAVIENEPTTDLFHTGPIENYITELETAVEVCKQFNVKVADGAIHIPYIEQVMNGNAGSGKALEVKKLIAAYRTIDLDYVNIHTQGPTDKDPDTYEPGLLKKIADYLMNETGKPVISNEWTVHNASSALVKNMVSEFRNADFKVAMVRSAYSPSGAVPLHKGTNLLPNGVTYSSEIK